MVSTASSYHALSTYGDSNYLLTRQLIFAVAGVVAMLVISRIDYKIYNKLDERCKERYFFDLVDKYKRYRIKYQEERYSKVV